MTEKLLQPQQRRLVKEYLTESVSEVLRRRAQILLSYDEGKPTREVARLAGLSPGRVRYWRRRFKRDGMEVFPPLSREELHLHPGSNAVTEPPEGLSEELGYAAPLTGLEVALETTNVSTQTGDISSEELINRQHLDHVSGLAATLFDRTQALHGLGNQGRHLLDAAIRLSGMSLPKGKKRTPAAIREWVMLHSGEALTTESPFGEFTPQEQNMLAALLALRQGNRRKRVAEQFGLTTEQEQEVFTLMAIIMISEGLDESHSQQTQIRQVEPNPNGLWIVVEGPQAQADAAAAQKRATWWGRIGYPKVKVLEASELESRFARYPPLPQPLDEVGLQPDDPMAEAGRKALLYHFAEMLSHEEGTRLGEDIEELHDMRVATRRMRAAFEIFGDAFDPAALKPHLKGLRATGRALGKVRDLDVFMEKAQHYLETLPEEQRSGLDPLLDAWKEKREAARSEMLDHLDSQQYQTFVQKFNLFLQTPGAGAKLLPEDHPTPNLVREIAPVLIYTRLASVRAYDQILKNAPIEQLHALRIEFKKLRYAVEFFREVLGEEAKAVIGDLKRLQDHLGDLNDADVATQILREFLDEWEPQQSALPIHERHNPEGVVTYLAARHSERYRLMVSFQDAWAEFNRPEFRNNLALAISVL